MAKKSLVIIKDVENFLVLPGESLTFKLNVDLSAEDESSVYIDFIQVDLKIDFRQPFSSDSIAVTSARADVVYAAIEGKKANV